MTATIDRAQEIIDKLTATGVRAVTDPSAAAPPCVLILPPDRRYDAMCGFSVTWTLVALAPGAQGADRTTWGLLDDLVDAAAQAVNVTDANLVAYTLNGVSYPAYLIRTEENL